MNKKNALKTKGGQLLSASRIEKVYSMDGADPLHVLKGIDLSIYEGEILAVVGHSGAGKSTLLHILGALDRPTNGTVHMEQTDLFSMTDRQLAHFRNRHVGFVFQFHHLLPEFTALENVAMPAFIQGLQVKESLKRASYLLDQVGLIRRQHHRPGELSGGEQQRVAFARALMNDPKLILADEPSGNLDLKNSQALHELMWDLVRRTGKTFVVVTHNHELAERADRLIELFDGRISTQT
ncbi:ABC transporter ATP-binding protein [bacterium]|nr:ABC transporter ATP-binding protein [bacterium]